MSPLYKPVSAPYSGPLTKAPGYLGPPVTAGGMPPMVGGILASILAKHRGGVGVQPNAGPYGGMNPDFNNSKQVGFGMAKGPPGMVQPVMGIGDFEQNQINKGGMAMGTSSGGSLAGLLARQRSRRAF